MTLKGKIIAGIASLGIVGVGVVGVNEACIDSNGITMFPAEELVLREKSENIVITTDKICFSKAVDYKQYKDAKINDYLALNEDDRSWWLLTEDGQALDDVLTHEIQKKGTIKLTPLKEGEDIFLKIINSLTQ